MLNTAHPGGRAFHAHSETGVRNCSETAQIEIPFKRLFRQIVRFDLFFQKLQIRSAFAATDNFAVTFGREQVCAEREFRSRRVACKIKRLDNGGKVMNKNGRVKMI